VTLIDKSRQHRGSFRAASDRPLCVTENNQTANAVVAAALPSGPRHTGHNKKRYFRLRSYSSDVRTWQITRARWSARRGLSGVLTGRRGGASKHGSHRQFRHGIHFRRRSASERSPAPIFISQMPHGEARWVFRARFVFEDRRGIPSVNERANVDEAEGSHDPATAGRRGDALSTITRT